MLSCPAALHNNLTLFITHQYLVKVTCAVQVTSDFLVGVNLQQTQQDNAAREPITRKDALSHDHACRLLNEWQHEVYEPTCLSVMTAPGEMRLRPMKIQYLQVR